ncbi:unnamed protein product [Trypanosoma congolense IL3000]|uniref:WGS project CAEQ00000000 data, annotated contig 863 n=1 Tax=Trypanosoma congolense (strain IL3000) TaxID=1068625 RepID=F9WJ26_TRYCI|nr:unnamed protein product [Trypanosoma congolense IL3000]
MLSASQICPSGTSSINSLHTLVAQCQGDRSCFLCESQGGGASESTAAPSTSGGAATLAPQVPLCQSHSTRCVERSRCNEGRAASPTSQASYHSFLGYLTKSALNLTESAAEEGGSRVNGMGDEVGASSNGPGTADAQIDSPSSRLLLATSVRFLAGEMSTLYGKLSFALEDDEGVIFGEAEKAEITDILHRMGETVAKMCEAAQGTHEDLNAYNTMSDIVLSRIQRHEKHVKQLTEKIEMCVDTQREALAAASRQLKNERAAIKTVLLRSGCQHGGSSPGHWQSVQPTVTSPSEAAAVGDVSHHVDSTCTPELAITPAEKKMEDNCEEVGSPLNTFLPPACWDSSAGCTSLENLLELPVPYEGPSDQVCVCSTIAQVPLHELANNLLRSRRQLSLVSQLSRRCPNAGELKAALLEKEMGDVLNVFKALEHRYCSRKERFVSRCFIESLSKLG